MSSDRGTLDRRAVVAALLAIAAALGAFAAPAGASTLTLASWAFASACLMLGLYLVWDAYRRNVTDLDVDPDAAASDVLDSGDVGGGDTDSDEESFSRTEYRLLGMRKPTFKMAPVWALTAIAPLIGPTDPIPGVVFPVFGVVGFYLTFRMLQGPLFAS